MSERVTFDELYRRSTQYRVWSFTFEELVERRKQVNQKGCEKVDERLRKIVDVDASMIEKVDVEEELQLVAFYAKNITKLANFLNMPSQVRATAISFLRKFYLVNSVMEYHPKNVLLTSLFLAAKSENYFISINGFCKRIPKTTPESILSLEFTILESLKFTLMTHHPFKPLYGFFYDIQDVLTNDDVSTKELGKIYDIAKNSINEAIMTDATYLFTPPQIALACLKEVNEDITLKYLNKKFSSSIKAEDVNEEDHSPLDQLIQVINECQQVIRSGAKTPTKEEAVVIDRKVQYSLNPSLVLKRKRDSPGEDDPLKRQRTESVEPTAIA